MHDGLKQVSKYLKDTRRKADYSFKREVPVEDYFERIRDVFDSENSFTGSWYTPENADKLTLDLNFGPRNPTLDCCADCVCSATESFFAADLVANSVYVVNEYIPESTKVFLDGSMLQLGVDYVEAGANKITFITLGEVYVVSYTFQVGNCHELEFPCLYENFPKPGIIGTVLMFADRFDRASGVNPTGHCGRWNTTISTSGGKAAGGDIIWPNGAIGATSEIIAAIDMTGTAPTQTWNVGLRGAGAYTSNFSYGRYVDGFGAHWQLSIQGYYQTKFDNSSALGEPGINKGVNISAAINYPIYVRFQQINNFGWQGKFWAQDEEEPTSWNIQLSIFDAANGVTYFNTYSPPNDHEVDRVIETGIVNIANASTAGSPIIQAVKIYSANDIGLICGANNIRIPEYGLNLTFPHFVPPDPGLADLNLVGQSVAWICSPNVTLIRMKGQVSVNNGGFVWIGGGWFGDFNYTLPVSFDTYNGACGGFTNCFGNDQSYGFRFGCDPPSTSVSCSVCFSLVNPNGCPPYNAYGFVGNHVMTAECPTSATNQHEVPDGGWQNFNFTMNPGEGGRATWGVQITDRSFIDTLPYWAGSFLFPNNANFSVSFRWVQAYGLPRVVCTAADFCPDHTGIAGRQPEIAGVLGGTTTSSNSTIVSQENGYIVTFTGNGDTHIDWNDTPIDVMNQADSEGYFEFQTDNLGEFAEIFFGGRFNGFSIDIDMWNNEVSFASVGTIRNSSGTFVNSPQPYTFSANQWYATKWQIVLDPALGTNIWDFKLKIWPLGSTEPDWTWTGITAAIVDGFRLAIDANGTNTHISVRNFSIKYIPGVTNPVPDPTPVPVPDPIPDPIPDPSPIPDPAPPPTGFPAFLSRPASAPISIANATDVEITNKTLTSGTNAIYLSRCNNVWIHEVDAANVVGFILVVDSTNVVIEDCRGRNIGDGSIGSGHSNYIQLARCRGGAIRRNRFLGGLTEDMVSIFQSGGTAASPLIIEDNWLEGLVTSTTQVRAWTSNSGTGIILGDGAGSSFNGYTIVRRNRLKTTGQVGINVIDGPGQKVYDNILYGAQRPQANVGMGTYGGNPTLEAYNNRVLWYSATGLNSHWWGAGTVNDHDNVWNDFSINPADLSVSL